MRSLRERIVHTVLFEALALAVATPAIAWLTSAPMADAGMLSLLVSAGALAANVLWTRAFDRWNRRRRRGAALRFLHACGLELLLMLYTVPLVMAFTAVSLANALLLEGGGIGFFIVFGAAYNAAFDAAVLRLAARSDGLTG